MRKEDFREFSALRSQNPPWGSSWDVIVAGCGFAGLSAAAVLAKKGKKVLALDQNWLPGGCASSYPRKDWIFESGATTLIGLDEGMPLHKLKTMLGIEWNAWKLDLPMQVHFPDKKILNRFSSLEQWIAEAEMFFGKEGQRKFWEDAYALSKKVWEIAARHPHFPPESWKDYLRLVKNLQAGDIPLLKEAFATVSSKLQRYGLDKNPRFRRFVDEQLMITAQNTSKEVNWLFGATALCYTMYGNYYSPGGMFGIADSLVHSLEETGGQIVLRQEIHKVEKTSKGYRFFCKGGFFDCEKFISGLSLNNTAEIFSGIRPKAKRKILSPEHLWSAFQMGIVFKRKKEFSSLHHQFLLEEPLQGTGAHSFFLSLSHPEDLERCGKDECVASVSTHLSATNAYDKQKIAEAIFQHLEENGILSREDVLYHHTSSQKSWHQWTGRKSGFVGGYPQFRKILPWQMMGCRLDGKGAFICGDSVYPGQGIPGVCLSGMKAAEKAM